MAPAISAPTSSAQTRLPFRPSGHVAGDDALREPLGDRRLADAGLADQHRVVLRAAREHLDRAPDLLVAADHRVELARLGGAVRSRPYFVERLVGALGILRRHALAAAHVLQRAEQRLARHELEREHEVLDRDELVVELARLVEGVVERLAERRRPPAAAAFAPRDGRQRPQARLGLGAHASRVGARALQQRARQLLLEQRHGEVVAGQLGVAQPPRQLLRGGDGLAGLDRQLVEIHRVVSSDAFSVGVAGGCGPVEDDLAPVLPVGLVDLGAERCLELLHPRAHPPQLVLEPQHVLDAREVEPELRRQLLDQPQPLDVGLGVEPRAARRARRAHEALRLVGAQRLRMHAGELRRDRDHVAGTVAHRPNALSRGRSRSTLS